MMNEAYERIKKMDDAAGRLGFEIREGDSWLGNFYEDIGRDLMYLIDNNPDQFDIIEATVIAICGYGFESLERRMEEHKEYYEGL